MSGFTLNDLNIFRTACGTAKSDLAAEVSSGSWSSMFTAMYDCKAWPPIALLLHNQVFLHRARHWPSREVVFRNIVRL
jgi:hypothetical protein